MKKFISAFLFSLVLLVSSAQAQTVPNQLIIDFSKATFEWTFDPGAGGQPDFFDLKIGTAPGVYTQIFEIADPLARSLPVSTAVTVTGSYWAVIVARNAFGVSPPSNEISFAAGLSPTGIPGLRITTGP